jgi:hypothetical protein
MADSSGSAGSNEASVLPDGSTKKTKSPFTVSSISKKKYKAIRDFVQKEFGEEVADPVCQKICEVFEFDPVIGVSKEKSQATYAWKKKKAAELGVSLYAVTKGLSHIKC